MKQKAIVWVTGVITQYSIEPNYSITNLQINNNLLNKLVNNYDIISVVCCKDKSEEEQYRQLFTSSGVASKMQFLFVPYNTNHAALVEQIVKEIPGITTYIDCDRNRLLNASLCIKNTNCIHLSQLID